MPTPSNLHCRKVYRTPTFKKSLLDLRIGADEADDIVRFTTVNAYGAQIEHRQLGFVLKRLPWKPQLWIQFLEDAEGTIYLLLMTDEEAGPTPPKRKKLLARALDKIWVAAAVKGAEWLADQYMRLTSAWPRVAYPSLGRRSVSDRVDNFSPLQRGWITFGVAALGGRGSINPADGAQPSDLAFLGLESSSRYWPVSSNVSPLVSIGILGGDNAKDDSGVGVASLGLLRDVIEVDTKSFLIAAVGKLQPNQEDGSSKR